MRIDRFKGALLSVLVITSIIALAIPLLSPNPVQAALTSHTPIYINGNDNFTPANGVVGGSGTENDPYIIENWDITAENAHGILIENTTAYFIVRGCNVHSGVAYKKYGIRLYNAKNGGIDNCIVENNSFGIRLDQSSNNMISNNIVKYNHYEGISLESSNTITMRNNTLLNNDFNFSVYGNTPSDFVHDIDASNIVNGKPIRYLVGNKNEIIGPSLDIGYLALVNCDNIHVENLTLSNHNGQGILLAFTKNSRVDNCDLENNVESILLVNSNNSILINNNLSNNRAYGIILVSGLSNTMENNRVENNYFGIYLMDSSSNNRIANNCVSGNGDVGICIVNSLNNTILNNNSLNNYIDGISLYISSNNVVENNRVENNGGCGIDISGENDGENVYYSSNNTLANNNVENNYWGIGGVFLHNNTIVNNNVSNNYLGIRLWYSSDNNHIYHNNITNNTTQANDSGSNFWDNGYLSGGNYWSDYTGADNYQGENQNIPGRDGVGDTPYSIAGGSNLDHYPLMRSWPPSIPLTEIRTVIYPTADVYAFGEYGTGYSRTQLKFDISSIPPQGRILSAKLWLRRFAADGWDGSVTLSRVDDQLWGENITASEFDSQVITNEETPAGKLTSSGWDYLDAADQLNADYLAGNIDSSFRLRWANDNGGEPSIGIDDGRFLVIDGSSFSLFLYSSEYGGNDPYLEVVYVPPYAVSVSISPTYNSGVPTEVLSYTVTVMNTGNLDDNYILTASDNSGWDPTVSPASLFIASGSAGEATLTVIVPENAKFCTMDNITITATSQADNTVSDNAWCLAHAAMVRGVKVSISPSYQSDLPSENLEYMVTVRNLGNIDDDYNLIAEDNENWSLDIASSIMVPAFENRTTTLTVAIPENATGGTQDNITVIATSQTDNTVSDNDSCIVHVQVVRGVEVSIEPRSLFGLIGENVVFTITVKNMGNIWENYRLENNDDAGWALKLDNDYLEIPKHENRETKLTVSVPDNKNLVFTTDNITIVATAVDNAEVTDNDTITVHAVLLWMGTAMFKLENLYKVGLEKDLQLYTGSKLVVKFYKYDNVTLQAESVIHENWIIPWHVVPENENVSQPRGAEGYPAGTVQIARLVLTTDNENEVISTIASFTVHQSDLRTRYGAILRVWGGQTEQQSAFRAEIGDILRQWSSAPP